MALKSTHRCHSVSEGEHSRAFSAYEQHMSHEVRSLQTGLQVLWKKTMLAPDLGLSPSFREQAGGQATHTSSALWDPCARPLWEALVCVHRA